MERSARVRVGNRGSMTNEAPILKVESSSFKGMVQTLLIFEDRIEVHSPETAGSGVNSLTYKLISMASIRPGRILDDLLIEGRDGGSLVVKNLYKGKSQRAKAMIEERINLAASEPRGAARTTTEGEPPERLASSHGADHEEDSGRREPPSAPPSGPSEQPGHTISLQRFSEVLGLYAPITAVILYPLGFLALCLQILKDPAFPSSYLYTAWYAASWIPLMVLLGTAAHVLFLSLVFSYVGLCISTVVIAVVRRVRGRERVGLERWRWFWRLTVIVGLVPAIIFTRPFLVRIDIGRPTDWVFLILAAVFSIGVGMLVGILRMLHRGEWFWRGLALSYGMALVAALCLAAVEYPALPRAELYPPGSDGSSNTPRERMPEVFQVLGHTEGRWYVYNERTGIISIPEAQVGTALVWDAAVDRPPLRSSSYIPAGAMSGWGPRLDEVEPSDPVRDVDDFFPAVDGKCIDTTDTSVEKEIFDADAVASCSYGYIDADFTKWPSKDKMDKFYAYIRTQFKNKAGPNPNRPYEETWSFSDAQLGSTGRKLEYIDGYDGATIFWTYDSSDHPMSAVAVHRGYQKEAPPYKEDALYNWWSYTGRWSVEPSSTTPEKTSTVGENPPPEEPAGPPPGYNLIQDPTGSLTLEAPSSWGVQTGSDSEGAGANWSTFVGEDITSSITTARSLEAWYGAAGEGSGAYIVTSSTLAQQYTNEALIYSGLFANLPTNHSCTTIGRPQDYVRPPYSGQIQTYAGCDGNDNIYVLVAAAPEGRECVAVMQARISNEADRAAVLHILDTFEVNCGTIAKAKTEGLSAESANVDESIPSRQEGSGPAPRQA
jgi:hypothetical protein